MSGVKRKRGPSTLGRNMRGLNKRLRQMAESSAIEIAQRTAVKLTTLLRESYDTGRTSFNETRPAGSEGQQLDLVETGKTRRLLKFVASGTTKTRVSLYMADDRGRKYGKYLIGNYRVIPVGNEAMPEHWRRAIDVIAADVLDENAWKALG